MTFVINFAAGGPTDIEGRIFAKHLSKHIPGQPCRGGSEPWAEAGGLTAVNYIGEVAKADGLTAGLFHGSLFQHQIKDPALRVDISQVWIHHRCPRSHRFLHPLGCWLTV